MADADGFDEDIVIARRLAKQDGGADGWDDTAEVAGAGARADEGVGVPAKLFHARLIPQDAAAAQATGRVHGQYGYALARLAEQEAVALNKGGFTDAGGAADAEAKGVLYAGLLQGSVGEGVRRRPVRRMGRFHQRNSAG